MACGERVAINSKRTYKKMKREIKFKGNPLDFNLSEEKESAVIEGWVVRDKRYISSILTHQTSKLYLCQEKPRRIDSMGIWDKEGDYCKLPNDLFPYITFGSDPLRVRIQITPME